MAQLEGSVMTFSLPSFLAAAISPFMPPRAAAEVAVLASAALVLLAEELAAAELLLDELELLQPAASRIDPTAAALATIPLDARKEKTSHAAPVDSGRSLVSWLDKSVS